MTSAARTDATHTNAADTGSAAKGIALSVVVATIGAGVLVFLISLAAQALGADPTAVMGLQPMVSLPLTLIGVLAGAIGWNIVRRRAANPARVLSWLVPTVIAVSLIPDVLVAAAFSPVGGTALGLMHLAVTAVAVPAYRRFLPLSR